jgi:MFS family permease
LSVSEPTALDPVQRRALSYPDYRAYIVQRLLTTLAISIQSVVVGWQVYFMTNSPFDLGVVGLAQFLPNIAMALYAGQLADRVDRKLILRCAIFVEFMCAMALAGLTLLHNQSVTPIYAVLVVFGAARAFMAPVSQSIIPRLVHREALGSALALGSSMFMIARIAGPAVGGALYVYGPTVAYGGTGLCLLASFISTWFIRTSLKPEPQLSADARSLTAGIRFIRQRPAILGAISLDLFAVLLGGATALLPVYARDILFTGPTGLGLLRAAPAVGAFVMSLYLARRSLGHHAGMTMFAAVALFGISTIVFGVSTSFPLSLISLIVLGAADMISVYMRTNLVQRTTPDEMRGRVSSVNWVFIGASNELGEMESGFTASLFGSAEAAVVVGGVGTLLIVGAWAWMFPALRKVKRLEDIQAG